MKFSVRSLSLSLGTLLALALLPGIPHAFATPNGLAPLVVGENPDEDAAEVRAARLQERKDREANRLFYAGQKKPLTEDALFEPNPANGPTKTVPVSPRAPTQPPVNLECKYVSDISNPPPKMRVALTFDDGPNEDGTPYILQVLAKYKIRATFFMIGQPAAAHPDLVKRVAAAGHLFVANHSWTHPHFNQIPTVDQNKEIIENQALIGKYEHPKFFRYPYGDASCESEKYLHSLGYKIVGWHVDSCDWAFDKTGTVTDQDAQICEVQPQNKNNFLNHVVERLHYRKGGILLMHEIHPNTIHQLETLIQRLQHDGFTFGTIDEPGFKASMR